MAICVSYSTKAGDTLIEQRIVNAIRAQQVSQKSDFEKGAFPSFRVHQIRQIPRKDNNSFFTALIGLTLREQYPKLSEGSKKVVDSILSDIAPVFHHFINQKGRISYNFWNTNPTVVFPNGGILNIYNKSRALPDDMDCTAMVLWALNSPRELQQSAKNAMQEFINRKGMQKIRTFTELDTLGAYSTWYGKKVPVEFDAAVLCNILSWSATMQLPPTKADSASIELLRIVAEKRLYAKDPFKVAPNYPSIPVILYHYSRLMSKMKVSELEGLKPSLVLDAQEALAKSHSFMEKILLSTAIRRWGADPEHKIIVKEDELLELAANDDQVFFLANMGLAFPTGWQNRIAISKAGRFDYFCPAYNLTVLLENLLIDPAH
jgi:hypothetical protein